MYPLGEQFKIKTNHIANEANIIKGNKFRITVITNNLIRFEYSESGNFLDLPTEFAWNRNLGVASFEKREDSNILEISNPYFKITYLKEKSFIGSKISPDSNLKVNILGTDTIWYYGNPEVRNLKTSGDDLSSSSLKEKGLYSLDGFVSIDDSTSKVLLEDGTFVEREFNEIDVYLFVYSKDFMLCLKNYFALTGNPPLIPRYVLGNWWSKSKDYSENDIVNLIGQFAKKRIPLSVFLFDDNWHVKNGYSFENKLITDGKGIISYLHNNGIHVGLSLNPTNGFYPIDELYKETIKYLTPDSSGVIPFEVLNPRWIDVYLKVYVHTLDSFGTDFYWLKNSSKTKKLELKLLNHYHSYDMLRNFENRPLLLTKYSGFGSHRYPVLYSGIHDVSWQTLNSVAYHNIQAVNNGIVWWAHDIGGFHNGIEESELYTRFVQLGTFSPILKFGSSSSKYYKREPWLWDIKTYSIAREYLNLRHQLIPYFYSLAYNYYKDCVPLIKGLYFDNPELIDIPRYKNQYFLGREMLVCPITNKKDETMDRVIHRMYIPAGTWYDFVTGKKFPGNKEYVSFFKDQDYPVFVRAGSIIPLAVLSNNINDIKPPKTMEIHVFPGCNNSFRLYEDDGETNLYLKGHYLLTNIEYKYGTNGYSLALKALEGRAGIVPDYRNYKIRFRNSKEGMKTVVLNNGESIPFSTIVDGNDFVVDIKNIKTTSQLVVMVEKDNFEVEATHIINDDVDDILNDLQIETEIKTKLSEILFSDLPIKKKRIEVRKLKGLDKKFIKLFLKLLEYIGQV